MIGHALDTVVRAAATPVAVAMLANQVEDLFVDLNYFLRGLHRRSKRHVSLQTLRAVEQKRTAILIPAWQESNVIQQMLDHNLSSIDYDRDRYEIFVGTYRNDPATQERVDEVAAREPAVHKVVVPHDGPTSKADCLNWVWQGIVAEEQRRGIRFDILLMHDAEDVIHPLSLRLNSLLIPTYEFVQSPVFSLPRELTDWIGATYVDEFAEHHLKEMAVRDALGGLVPSAGVGSAFDRDAFEDIALLHGQQPFEPTSLTEDYEIGLKFHTAGKRVLFAVHSVDGARDGAQPKPSSSLTFEPDAPEEYIATREFFPNRFQDSVRQRSRWVLGITMQAWESWGWKGNAAVRWCLWRDRKALLTYPLLLLAYAIFAYVLVREGVAWATGASWDVSVVIVPGTLTWTLVLVNTVFLAWRASLRFHFVRQLHGTRHGLLALPRLVVNNVVGVAAMARATKQWLRHRATGEPLRWFKTAHVFPTAEALGARRARLGEMLVARRAVAPADVDRALELQRQLKLPIGEVFSTAGFASARVVVRALGAQLGIPSATIDPGEIPVPLLGRMSEAEAERLDVLPLGRERRGDPIRIATARPLADAEQANLSEKLGGPVAQVLTLAPDLRRARSVAYRRARQLEPPRQPRLGEVLVSRGALSPETLREALDEQAESGEMLAEVLLRHGVPLEALSAALAGIAAPFRRVAAGDGDPEAVAFARYGFCAIHGMVPLTREAASPAVEGSRVVAAAYPLHRETLRALTERLGHAVEIVLAPMTDVRFALAIAAKASVRGRALRGADGAELAVLVERGVCEDPAEWMVRAREAGTTPIAWAELTGAADAALAAEMRAQALGLSMPVAPALDPAGIVPPRLLALGVEVREAAPGELVLSAPQPDTALTRQVARALPGWRIAWQVSGPITAGEGEAEHAA